MTSSSSSSPEISSANPAEPQDRFSYKHATHDEVLEDLSSRFILNLPDEELASLERVCFQVEQAHWFYEDFIREENPKFPSLPLKKFSAMLFHACPLLHQWSHDHEQAFNNFMQYKTRVPVCGAIMLNDTWEKCLLVKGWKASSGWGFPKGKINEDEPEPNCAIREVLEETGYNLAGQINPDNVIEMSIKEQKISLYIVPGVPEDFPFKTRTRKEISKIEWFKLTDLPTWKRSKASSGKFYLISPFIGALKAFINERKSRAVRRTPKVQNGSSSKISHCRTEGKESQAPPSYHDQKQESSSQSSSADNGDPQTPSPLYSEPATNIVSARPNVVEDDVPKTIATQSLDPQLARLLTSLSLSASGLKQSGKTTSLSVKTNDPTPSEPTTPVPNSAITASSANSHSRSGSIDGVGWWTSSPKRKPVSAPHARRFTIETNWFSPHHQPTSTLSFPNPASPNSLSSWPNIISQTQPGSQTNLVESQSSGQPSSASSTTSSAMSPSRLSSRRSSSTADISPYLLRSAEIPMSGKRLKQLALLESVADESARMTPILGKRESINGGNLGSNTLPGNRHSFAYGVSAPPPPLLRPNDPIDLRVIYSSNIGAVSSSPSGALPAAQGAVHQPPVSDDLFRVRPRPTYAGQHLYTGIPNGSVSMNQDQLSGIVNGPRPADLRPPTQIPNHSHATFYTSPPPPPPIEFGMAGPPLLSHRHSFAGLNGMCSPLLPGPTTTTLSGLESARMNNNTQLLSILNGDPTAVVRNVTFPPTPNSIGR